MRLARKLIEVISPTTGVPGSFPAYVNLGVVNPKAFDLDVASTPVSDLLVVLNVATSLSLKESVLTRFGAYFIHDVMDLISALGDQKDANVQRKLFKLRDGHFTLDKIKNFAELVAIIEVLAPENRVHFMATLMRADEKKLQSLITKFSDLAWLLSFARTPDEMKNIVLVLGQAYVAELVAKRSLLQAKVHALSEECADLSAQLGKTNELHAEALADDGDLDARLINALVLARGELSVRQLEAQGQLELASRELSHVSPELDEIITLAQTLAGSQLRKEQVLSVEAHRKPIVLDEEALKLKASSVFTDLLKKTKVLLSQLEIPGSSLEALFTNRNDLVKILNLISESELPNFLSRFKRSDLERLIPSVNDLGAVLGSVPLAAQHQLLLIFDRHFTLNPPSDDFMVSLTRLAPNQQFGLLATLVPGSLGTFINTKEKLFSLLEVLNNAEAQLYVIEVLLPPKDLAALLTDMAFLDEKKFKAEFGFLPASVKKTALIALCLVYEHQRAADGREYTGRTGSLFGSPLRLKRKAVSMVIGFLKTEELLSEEALSSAQLEALVSGRFAKFYEAACELLRPEAPAVMVAAAATPPLRVDEDWYRLATDWHNDDILPLAQTGASAADSLAGGFQTPAAACVGHHRVSGTSASMGVDSHFRTPAGAGVGFDRGSQDVPGSGVDLDGSRRALGR